MSAIRPVGLLAALVMVIVGLTTPAHAAAAGDPAAPGLRLVADARWDRTLAVRYRQVETEAPEPEAPTFRSGTREAAPAEAAPLLTLSAERPLVLTGYLETDIPLVSRPGEPGSWLEGVVPAERDLGLFLAAQSALLVDMAQTLEIRRSGGLEETNPVLGERPSDGAVFAYFGSIAAVHAASYLALDARWANILSRAILFVQVPAIDNNARLGVRISF